MSDDLVIALAGALIGALVGSTVSTVSAVYVKRRELRQARRLRLYDELLPALIRGAAETGNRARAGELLTDRVLIDELHDVARASLVLGEGEAVLLLVVIRAATPVQEVIDSARDAVAAGMDAKQRTSLLVQQANALDNLWKAAENYSAYLIHKLVESDTSWRPWRRVRRWLTAAKDALRRAIGRR